MKTRPKTSPSFSQIVCGSPQVLAALKEHAPTRAWWTLILKLHGKPVEIGLSHAARTQRVAAGFRFYAALYRALSIIFGLLCPALAALGAMNGNLGGLYWAGASLLGAGFLWFASGLGFVGARSYALGNDSGRASLLAFMVMIVAFLAVFVGAASVAAHQTSRLGAVPNLLACAALFVLGVGSYLIEILYLATDCPAEPNDISRA